jgi:hypothetical protein
MKVNPLWAIGTIFHWEGFFKKDSKTHHFVRSFYLGDSSGGSTICSRGFSHIFFTADPIGVIKLPNFCEKCKLAARQEGWIDDQSEAL